MYHQISVSQCSWKLGVLEIPLDKELKMLIRFVVTQYERPARNHALCHGVRMCLTKAVKSSREFTRKDPFLRLETSEWSSSLQNPYPSMK